MCSTIIVKLCCDQRQSYMELPWEMKLQLIFSSYTFTPGSSYPNNLIKHCIISSFIPA